MKDMLAFPAQGAGQDPGQGADQDTNADAWDGTDEAPLVFLPPVYRSAFFSTETEALIQDWLETAPRLSFGRKVVGVRTDYFVASGTRHITRDLGVTLIAASDQGILGNISLSEATGTLIGGGIDRGRIETPDAAAKLGAILLHLASEHSVTECVEGMPAMNAGYLGHEISDCYLSHIQFRNWAYFGQEYLPNWTRTYADEVGDPDASADTRSTLASILLPNTTSAHEELAQAAQFDRIAAEWRDTWALLADSSIDELVPGAPDFTQIGRLY